MVGDTSSWGRLFHSAVFNFLVLGTMVGNVISDVMGLPCVCSAWTG